MNVTPFRRPMPEGIPGDIETLISDFLVHRRARGMARNTEAAYAADLRLLASYLRRHDVTLVQLIGDRLLNRWLDDGLLHLGWSRRTAARRLSAVRSFLAWARLEGYVDYDPAEHVQIRFRPRRVVAPELEPLKRVIAEIGTEHILDVRDRAILMLLLDAALRAGEVAQLEIVLEDGTEPDYWVDTRGRRVYVRPKGGDDGEAEVVGIEEQTARMVDDWLRVRSKLALPACRALFVNTYGRGLSRASLYHTVKRRGAAVGLPALHPHLFRHRRIGDVVETLGLDVGAALARHRHKSTTVNVYGAHAAEVQRNAIRTMAPLGEVRP